MNTPNTGSPAVYDSAIGKVDVGTKLWPLAEADRVYKRNYIPLKRQAEVKYGYKSHLRGMLENTGQDTGLKIVDADMHPWPEPYKVVRTKINADGSQVLYLERQASVGHRVLYHDLHRAWLPDLQAFIDKNMEGTVERIKKRAEAQKEAAAKEKRKELSDAQAFVAAHNRLPLATRNARLSKESYGLQFEAAKSVIAKMKKASSTPSHSRGAIAAKVQPPTPWDVAYAAANGEYLTLIKMDIKREGLSLFRKKAGRVLEKVEAALLHKVGAPLGEVHSMEGARDRCRGIIDRANKKAPSTTVDFTYKSNLKLL